MNLSADASASANLLPLPVPFDMDLTSTSAIVSAGRCRPGADNDYGRQRQTSDKRLRTTYSRRETCCYQVPATGGQLIIVGDQGNAVGGNFTIGPKFGLYVVSLAVPSGVTAIKDFASSPVLALGGDLVNRGVLYATSTREGANSGLIDAANIYNQAGALITSELPVEGVPGFENALAPVNLSLSAQGDIVNYGRITGSGDQALSAGGAVKNITEGGAGTAAMRPVI